MKVAVREQAVGEVARESADRRLAALYIGAVSMYWISLYLYMPTLPAYAESKTDSLVLVGTALSMYGLMQAIVRLPLGIVSDWLGRRKVFILVGFGLAGLGAYLVGAAGSIQGVIVGRAITGIAAGTWVPLVVAFSSLYPPKEAVRASAILTFVGSFARVLATAVTGSLNALGARLLAGPGTTDEFAGYPLAYYLAAGAAVLAVVALLPARETPRPRKPFSVGSIGRIVTRRDVLLPSALSAVAQYGNWGATFGFFPILAGELGASDVTVSLMLSLNIGVLTLGNLAATGLVRRMGSRRLVYLSFTSLVLGLGAGAMAPTLAVLFLAQVLVGVSQGFGYPVLMGLSIRDVAEAERTTAMGLHQAVYAIGMFAGPWMGGILANAMGIRPMFGVTAVAILLVGFLGARLLAGRPVREAQA